MSKGQIITTESGDTHPVHNLCGWLGVDRPDIIEKSFEIWSAKPKPITALPPVKAGSRSMLWETGRKILGTDSPNYPQLRGDCCSFGWKNACEYVQFFPILNNSRNKWTRVFPPYSYGCSRVFIGKGQLGNQDGSSGFWTAEAAVQYGAIPIDAPNCPKYSSEVAQSWGYNGPPKEFVPIGKEHLIKNTSPVTTWDELLAALTNGYPVTIASNVGFDMLAAKDGFHHYTTNWAHQLCIVPQTLISQGLTAKCIENIMIGDQVLSHKGKLRKVTEVFKREYNGQIIKIKGSGHLPIEVTPNHPILVLRDSETDFDYDSNSNDSGGVLVAKSKKVKKWVNAEDIVLTDKLISPRPKFPTCDPTIPKWIDRSRAKLDPIKFSRDFAWFCGLYAADGNSSPNHRIRIKLSKGQDAEADRCALVANHLGLKARIKHVDNYIHIIIHSAVLANSFLAWFGKQTNKHLPDWLFTGWPLDAVLEGVFDGDGNYTRTPTARRIVNTSSVLIDQCRSIILHLGFSPSIGKHIYKEPNAHWNPRFYVEWYIGTKNKKINHLTEDELLIKISSISSRQYTGPVYNFEVESDHSYLAEGISVHNCCIGVDDDPGDPYGCIINSWSDVHGHLKDFKTGETWPVGTLRVRKKDIITMLNANDSFAYSSTDLFVAQELSEEDFNLW